SIRRHTSSRRDWSSDVCSSDLMDEPELRNLMFTAKLPEMKHPIAIRYPRGKGVTVEWHTPFEAIPIGKGRLIQEGNEVAILSYGHSGNFVVEATQTLHKEGLYPAHYDMRFVKPLDKDLLHHVFTQFDKVITIEEGIVNGGFGSAILEWANENNYHHNQIKILGIHDKIIRQGNPEEQRREAKVDAAAIIETVEALTGAKITHEQNI